MKNLYLALLVLFSFSTEAFAGDEVQNACNVFYKKLEAVPHYKLIVNTGLLHSVSTGEEFRGCEVVFKSNKKLMAGLELPSFEAKERSRLYREGWRIDEHYRADGAGSGAYGIVKGRLLCRISWDQYSFVNDAGEVEQSELINMTIQCMNLQKLHSPEYYQK